MQDIKQLLSLKTTITYDIFFHTLLHTNEKFCTNFSLSVGKVIYGDDFVFNTEDPISIDLFFGAIGGGGVSTPGDGVSYRMTEKEIKAILLVEIDKLSKLERVIYGL